MKQKNFLLLVGFFLIFSINFASADGCVIVTENNCVSPNQIVMRLSDSTNAHGELASQSNYNTALCCDFGLGDTTCTADNKILGLSSVTNAHAEIPELTTYTNSVCYDSLNYCGFVNTTRADDEREIIGISSDTNAHLGGINDYKPMTLQKRIVCTVAETPASCNLTSASWDDADGEVINGTPVDMVVEGTEDCGTLGVEISFEVLRESTPCGEIEGCAPPANVNFESGSTTATRTWTAGPSSDTNYKFTAIVVGSSPSEEETSSNELHVTEAPGYCTDVPVVYCRDYENADDWGRNPQTDCEENVCPINVQDSFSPNLGVDCSASNVESCDCSWNTTSSSCGPSVTYKDTETSSGIGTCYYTADTTDNCDDGQLTVTWQTWWEWSPENPGHEDPEGLVAQCAGDNGKSDVMACPAQIPLPFFNLYNLLAAIAIIAIIYLAIHSRKGRKKGE